MSDGPIQKAQEGFVAWTGLCKIGDQGVLGVVVRFSYDTDGGTETISVAMPLSTAEQLAKSILEDVEKGRASQN